METTPDAPLVMNTTLKLAIQKDLLVRVKRATIGLCGVRSLVFVDFNTAMLSRYFSLRFLDGSSLPPSGGLERAMDELTVAALLFYANRTDHLSVTDYVTDFPEIVKRCHFSLVHKEN